MLNFSIGCKNSLSKKFFNFIFIAFAALIISCSSKPTKPGTGVVSPSGEYSASTPSYEEKKVYGIILGPGGYRTFAQAGFIKELGKENFPIHAIVGLEWGSMIGALYAVKGQPHDLDWKLFKLENRDLPKKSLLNFFSAQSSISVLDRFLQENFKGMDMSQTKIEFACSSMNRKTSHVKLFETGEMSETLKKCIAYPPLFRGQDNDWAAPSAGAKALAWLKSQGVNRVIYLDVLGETVPYKAENKQEEAWATMWSQAQTELKGLLPEVDWITLPVQEFSMTDFDKRRELVLRGERSAKQYSNALKESR